MRKPGKLDDEEFKVMKMHPEKGRKIIDAVLEDSSLGDLVTSISCVTLPSFTMRQSMAVVTPRA